MPYTSGSRLTYRCSFCGKSQDQVHHLMGGPGGVFICDECIALCQEIIFEESEPADIRVRSMGQGIITTSYHISFSDEKDEKPQYTPTPCPECKSERLLATSDNNVRFVERQLGPYTVTELWAAVCSNCGHTTFYAKKPDILTR